jgi:hypothetical protein
MRVLVESLTQMAFVNPKEMKEPWLLRGDAHQV